MENIQGNVNNIFKRNGKHEREMLSKINNEPNKQVLHVITNVKKFIKQATKINKKSNKLTVKSKIC